jgi:opacity protein-like surface antigen
MNHDQTGNLDMNKASRKLAALLALLLMSTAFVAHADEAQNVEPYEAWFVMNMGGQKAGYMHITYEQVGDKLVSKTDMQLSIKRGNADMKIAQTSRFEETLDFKPIVAESSMALGAMATGQKLDFNAGGGKWKMTTTTAGQQQTSTIDPPDADWLTPGALAKAMEDALKRGDQEITATTLDLSMGTKPVTMTMKRVKEESIEVFGKVVPATKWTTTMTALPGVEVEQWTDDAGQPVRQVVPMLPGMEMEMLLADKELALAEFDAPEMLAASLITPNKPIKNPRTLKRGVFDLVSPGLKEAYGDAAVNAGFQQTKWIDDNTLRVMIGLDQPVKSNLPKADKAEYLAATSMLNHEDDKVSSLVTEAGNASNVLPWVRGDGPERIERDKAVAGVFRSFVRNHIEAKDLSVGYASASEVVRTRQGDCTEHACLLAAMLRGAGFPSRTVTGVVYADQFAGHEGVFGFHMWAQAWIATGDDKGYWLDLDAAAPGEINGFDATHIALSTSAMKDEDSFNDMVKMLPLLQGLKVEVVELEWAE